MKITQEEVTHVANLSKLKFSPEETAAVSYTHLTLPTKLEV